MVDLEALAKELDSAGWVASVVPNECVLADIGRTRVIIERDGRGSLRVYLLLPDQHASALFAGMDIIKRHLTEAGR